MTLLVTLEASTNKKKRLDTKFQCARIVICKVNI